MPVKNKNPEDYLNIMREVAEKNNGKLLSTEWIGSKKKYRFCFASGKEFEMKYDQMIISWPKNEAKYLKSNRVKDKKPEDYLNIMREVAEKNNGKLLSTEWRGTTGKYEFSFASGLKFERLYRNIIKGWPKNEAEYFAHLKSRDDNLNGIPKIKNLKNIVASYGHTLLSTEIITYDRSLEIKLSTNEIIYVSPRNIIKGDFINKTGRGLVTEPIFKQAFEYIFNKPFYKTNKIISTILNGKKRHFELDGYCEELKIAFEYQGHAAHWDINHTRYEATSKCDQLKKQLCEQSGIVLIQIPRVKENKNKWQPENILSLITPLIKEEFLINNRFIPDINIKGFKIDFSIIHHSNQMMDKLKSIAFENNGRLISTTYLGVASPLLFEFNDGTKFQSTPRKLIKKGWPKDIGKYVSYSKGHSKSKTKLMLELSQIASKHKLQLISNIWMGNKNKYEFKNDKGEIVKISAHALKKRIIKE